MILFALNFTIAVAARVVDKSKHAIRKQPLQVSLYIPPKPEPPPKSADNMLLLKDLPEKFKEANLELYLDGITDLEYEEDEYTYDIKQYEGDTVVLVTFNSEAGSITFLNGKICTMTCKLQFDNFLWPWPDYFLHWKIPQLK